MNAGFSDRCVARDGNTVVPPLFPTSSEFFSALRRLYFGRAAAIVRLRCNQNSAMQTFLYQIADRIKASMHFRLMFFSAQSTHSDYILVPMGHACLPSWAHQAQKFHRHLKLPDSRRGCSRLAPGIQIHQFGYITSWRLLNLSSASLSS